MAKKPKKVPAGSGYQGPPRKSVPAAAHQPPGFAPAAQGLFIVRWTKFDFNGPWCLAESDSAVIVKLMSRVCQMETMTPGEVFRPPTGPGVDYGDPALLPNTDAYQRLVDLGLSDETNISRLRINGEQRLYGFRRDPEFYAVFWDPQHRIWPSKRRNT